MGQKVQGKEDAVGARQPKRRRRAKEDTELGTESKWANY